MRMHPVYAYQLLQPIPCLRPTLDIPYCHHEKWDGTGYPRGLKGEQIPFAALKKADSFRKELNLSRSYCVQVLNMTYHDTQYGFPIDDDNLLFERLILEINQAGLS